MEKEKKEGELLLPEERREYPRVAMTIKVLYRILDGSDEDQNLIKNFNAEAILTHYKEAESINLSKSGILMFADEEIKTKSFVSTSMYIPLPGFSCNVRALAEVVRCDRNEQKGKYIVALKFLKLLHHNLNKFKYVSLKDMLAIDGENIKID